MSKKKTWMSSNVAKAAEIRRRVTRAERRALAQDRDANRRIQMQVRLENLAQDFAAFLTYDKHK